MEFFDSTYNNNGFDNGFDADNNRLVKIIIFEIFHKINSLLYNPFFYLAFKKLLQIFLKRKVYKNNAQKNL